MANCAHTSDIARQLNSSHHKKVWSLFLPVRIEMIRNIVVVLSKRTGSLFSDVFRTVPHTSYSTQKVPFSCMC